MSDLPSLLQPLLGLLLITALAWGLSEDRRAVRPRLVIGALALQLLLAVVLLKLPAAKGFFLGLNQLVLAIQAATQEGTAMVFGYLGGGPLPFDLVRPENSFVLAFRCGCSRRRIEDMLRTLGEAEVGSMVTEQGAITVTCEFCNRTYRLDAVDAGQLFTQGSRQALSAVQH